MIQNVIKKCCLALLLFSGALYGGIKGKVDLGGAYVHIDVLESGKTVKAMHIGGLKGDATILVWKGVGVKGGFLAASGQGDLLSGFVGVGHYTPITDRITLFPSVGVTWSYLRTKIDLEQFNMFDLKERFRSVGPFIALEFNYKFNDRWTLIGQYQYAWSRTHTKIKPLVSSHSHSDGANYSLGIDYTINNSWSVNFGGAYNISLSHEKHGLRGYGCKLGAAFYF